MRTLVKLSCWLVISSVVLAMPLWSFSDALPEQPSRAGLAGAETARAGSDIAATDRRLVSAPSFRN